MNIFKQGIKKRRNLYRGVCFFILLITLASLILSMLMICSIWFFAGMMVLFAVVYAPIFILDTYNRFDYILFFLMVLSLLFGAGVVMDITNAIFHNTNVSIYLGITSFFTFSYLYDIYFREIAKSDYNYGLLSPITDLFKGFYAMSAQAAVSISKTCNIIQLVLLVFTMFSTQTDLLSENIKNLPFADAIVTQAIVTSLAIEKLIQSFYSKLGTKVDIPNQEQC